MEAPRVAGLGERRSNELGEEEAGHHRVGAAFFAPSLLLIRLHFTDVTASLDRPMNDHFRDSQTISCPWTRRAFPTREAFPVCPRFRACRRTAITDAMGHKLPSAAARRCGHELQFPPQAWHAVAPPGAAQRLAIITRVGPRSGK
jgi:hypothetical protein